MIKQLARRMGLTLVVIKKYTWRTMQLGNNNALSTVNHKGTVVGHQGNFPHVDFLLADFFDRFRIFLGILIVNDQLDRNPQWRGISHATQLAFLHIKRRGTQTIINILQTRATGITDNRQHAFQSTMQSIVTTFRQRHVGLEKFTVRRQLDFQQVRYLHDFRKLAEIFTDTFLFSEGVSHLRSSIMTT